MQYKDAMENYGSDKPDLRFDLKFIDVIDIFTKSNNEIFANIAKDTKKNRIKAIRVPKGDTIFQKDKCKDLKNLCVNLAPKA